MEDATIINPLEGAYDKVGKGERVRLLMEILMKELGFEIGKGKKFTYNDIFEGVKAAQEGYNEGMEVIRLTAEQNGHKPMKTEGVSVSN